MFHPSPPLLFFLIIKTVTACQHSTWSRKIKVVSSESNKEMEALLSVWDIPDFREPPRLPLVEESWPPSTHWMLLCWPDCSLSYQLHLSVPLCHLYHRRDPSRSLQLQSRCSNCHRSTAAAPRSAPEADVAHGLAGGAALCGREVDLATGTNAHLVHGLLLRGLPGRRCVGAEREASKLNGVGI